MHITWDPVFLCFFNLPVLAFLLLMPIMYWDYKKPRKEEEKKMKEAVA